MLPLERPSSLAPASYLNGYGSPPRPISSLDFKHRQNATAKQPNGKVALTTASSSASTPPPPLSLFGSLSPNSSPSLSDAGFHKTPMELLSESMKGRLLFAIPKKGMCIKTVGLYPAGIHDPPLSSAYSTHRRSHLPHLIVESARN